MRELESVKRLNDIKQSIETATGESYNDLTEAVKAALDGYGQGEEFSGVNYSNFGGTYNLPQVADARSLEKIMNNTNRIFIAKCLFYNPSANSNGGYHSNLKEIYMPSGTTNWASTFQNCGALRKVYGNFDDVKSLGLTFQNCYELEEAPYLPSLVELDSQSYANCRKITSLCFYKTLTKTHYSALSGCSNLKDIYVSWGEDEVAGAPWGATNATIHYNTQYDENHNPIISEV